MLFRGSDMPLNQITVLPLKRAALTEYHLRYHRMFEERNPTVTLNHEKRLSQLHTLIHGWRENF
jgi:hypothetical protein